MTLTAVRELITTLTSLVLSFTSPNGDFLDFGYREPVKGRTVYTYMEDTKDLKNPNDVGRFFHEFVEYDPLNDKHDGHPGHDYMQNPLETYLVGKGDCDDYANIACKFLRKNGYEAQTIGIYGDKFGHAVCVYIDDGFRIISNDRPNKKFRSLKEIAEHYRKNWSKIQFMEENILSLNGYEVTFEKNRDGSTTGKAKFPMELK